MADDDNDFNIIKDELYPQEEEKHYNDDNSAPTTPNQIDQTFYYYQNPVNQDIVDPNSQYYLSGVIEIPADNKEEESNEYKCRRIKQIIMAIILIIVSLIDIYFK